MSWCTEGSYAKLHISILPLRRVGFKTISTGNAFGDAFLFSGPLDQRVLYFKERFLAAVESDGFLLRKNGQGKNF
jgi:hypothetical protein